MGAAAAIIIRKERDVVDACRRAGATAPEWARSLGEMGVDDQLAVRRLIDRAVLREAEDGRFYLDELSWGALRRIRHRVLGLVLVLMVILLIAVFMTATSKHAL